MVLLGKSLNCPFYNAILVFMKTIFITIPSYEDPDLIKTIDAALANASYPKSLHFAIALQYKNVPMPQIEKYYRRPNMRFTYYDVDTRPGVCQVRHDLLDLYDGQDYLLMLDSHMTFMPNWDEILIREYENIRQQESNSSVIITHTTGDTPEVSCQCFYSDDICEQPHRLMVFKVQEARKSLLQFEPVTHMQKILNRTVSMVATNTNKNYELVRPAAAGFFFSSGQWVSEVGIVDGVNIIGEEALMAFRSYLAGWDIYTLKNIDIIGHDAKSYNITVYGEEMPTNKLYSRHGDDQKISSEINRAFLFNSGRFSVSSAKRTPEEFWYEIGLAEEFIRAARAFRDYQ